METVLPPPSHHTHLTLCATSRLAQHLRASAPPSGSAVWPTVQALTTAQWLSALSDAAYFAEEWPEWIVLSEEQAAVVWETTLASQLHGAESDLFDRAGLAAALAEADALCVTWGIDPAAGEISEETRFFIRVRDAFAAYCRARGWIDKARLQQHTLRQLAEGHLPLPGHLRLTGFDRLSPLEQRIVEICAGRSVPVEVEQSREHDSHAAALAMACDDLAAECRTVAAWAADQHDTRPEARIGIVVPDLASLRPMLESALDDRLHPAWVRPGAAECARLFNFSLGDALSDLPLVSAALDWLTLAVNPQHIEHAAFSALLRSPFWSIEAESDARAISDASGRRTLAVWTNLDAVLALLRRESARGECARLPVTLNCLEALAAASVETRRRLLPSDWRKHFLEWLGCLRWPGSRTLSSHEYQARQAFLELLEAFGKLDDVLGAVPGSLAVARLARMAGERVFQAKGGGNAPIQVLGVLESAGLPFDALWVMGMNDHLWPPAPRPNPFLPAALQRTRRTPHASAELELEFARGVHNRLLAAAPRVMFSFSRMEGDRLLRPSPLLSGLAVQRAAPPAATTVPTRLTRLPDWQGPPLAEGETVMGGSGLLKAQAICPAWAFYTYRLGARALEAPLDGLDGRARGSLLHAVLECFWKAVGDSAHLGALSDEGREQAVTTAVQQGLAQFEASQHIDLAPRFRASEARRLHRLMVDWLTLEAGRKVAFEVVATEREATIDLAGLSLRVVVDRIDRLADGQTIVIDYKTGANLDIKNWTQPRLKEPQLPLYACFALSAAPEMGVPVGAVFAQVRPDKIQFVGVSANGGTLPGVMGLDDARQKLFDRAAFPDWQSVLGHWSRALSTVAAEVCEGVAAVRFSDDKDLAYCDAMPLLRLPERMRLAQEGDA